MMILSTMLMAVDKFGEAETVRMLESGILKLTGNFKGRELEVVAAYKEVA